MKRLFPENSLTGILRFLLLGAVGIGVLSYAALSGWRCYDSLSWPFAEGRVLASKVTTHTGGANSRTSNHVPNVRYEFTVDGQRHTGERLAFGFVNRSPDVARKLVGRFQPERRIRVFYDPAEHSRSVLMPGFHGNLWLGWLIGLLFLGAAFFMRWYDAWFLRRRALRSQKRGPA